MSMIPLLLMMPFASIFIDVRGGAVDVDDWVVEAPAQIDGPASVWEVGDDGRPTRAVASQADGDVVAFHLPGPLAAGQTRRFTIGASDAAAPFEQPLHTATDDGVVTVARDGVVVEHHASHGGLPARITIDGQVASFSFNDKIYDGTVYYAAHQSALALRTVCSGPLRAVVEASVRFGGPDQVDSKAEAHYRFTYLAGQPVVRMAIELRQDFARGWRSAHPFEMQIGAAPLTHVATDEGGGRLEGAGQFHGGSRYAAVYGPHHLLATLANPGIGVYDGGGRHYGAYLRLGTTPWSSTHHRTGGVLLIGSGAADLPALERWARLLAAPPTVRVRLPALADRLAAVSDRLDGNSADLGAVVTRALARQHLLRADRARRAGRFRAAFAALDACEAALATDATTTPSGLRRRGNLQAGVIGGHPVIANRHVAWLFARPEAGGGLIDICQRPAGRHLLNVDPAAAPLWQAAIKGAGFDNIGSPCTVTADVTDRRAALHFTWRRDIDVTVDMALGRDEGLLRGRIRAHTARDDQGLITVTFPVVDGIVPLSDGDDVLETWGLGWQKPAPLRSGSPSSTQYPRGMQFSALLGDGLGLYVAEEDPTAASKTLAWTPQPDRGTTRYSVAHPVLDFAGRRPVRAYELPGPAVMGPFAGDWYDAAQIYRRWALTAPWAAKGPIHARSDYPDWLKRAPYFTIGNLGDEHDIGREYETHAFYDVPEHVAHTYNYYIMQHQDDEYPEYLPPKLGSAAFQRVVHEMKAAGIHVVPYVNGWLWDQDSESYRMRGAARDAALLNRQGEPAAIMKSYGGGQSFVGMCPATALWRQQLAAVSRELVGRYGAHGIYYDFLTIHAHDCLGGETHGHANGGGDFWSRHVRATYAALRGTLKELDPDVMLCGEDSAEWCIDLFDTALELNKAGTTAPLFPAVYGDYTNVFGGHQNCLDPTIIGRTFLLGMQCGWYGPEWSYGHDPAYAHLGALHRRLIRCRWQFAWPYLSTGRMLRPPAITGDLPALTGPTGYGDYHVAAVEATAWQAPDGSVGVFILNHDDSAHAITWSMPLAPGDAVWRVTRWHEDKGEMPAGALRGPLIRRQHHMGPRELIALKLEAGS